MVITAIYRTLSQLMLYQKNEVFLACGSNRVGATHVFPYQRQLRRAITLCGENRIETTNIRKLNIAYRAQ